MTAVGNFLQNLESWYESKESRITSTFLIQELLDIKPYNVPQRGYEFDDLILEVKDMEETQYEHFLLRNRFRLYSILT